MGRDTEAAFWPGFCFPQWGMSIFSNLVLSAALAALPVTRQAPDSVPVATPPMELPGEPISMTLVALGLLGMTVSDRRRRAREKRSTGLFWVRFL